MKQTTKAVLACLFALLFFSFFLTLMFHGGDYQIYFAKATGGYVDEKFDSLPPLFSWIASFFGFRPEIFQLFCLFFFACLTPLLLFKITDNWLSVWFYFSTTNYFYFIMAGLFNQGTVLILLLVMFAFKSNWVRGASFLLGLLAHSTGFYLLSLAWVLLLIQESKINFKKIIPFCSPFWGKEIPSVFETKISNPNAFYASQVSINTIGSFLLKRCPFPFFYWGLKEHWKRKNWAYLALIMMAFFGAWFENNRTLYVVPLMIIPALTWKYESSNSKTRKLIIALSILWGLFLFEQFWALGTGVLC